MRRRRASSCRRPLRTSTRCSNRHGLDALTRAKATTLQVNLGKLCNQACHHCHVDAGPARTERMERATADRLLEVLAHSPAIRTVDLTGGAPELNGNFRMLVEGGRRAGREVMVRCNLTVMFEPGMERLGEFYRDNRVVLVCSLPCYSAANVERQRGRGVFEKSIAALQKLNALGYGAGRPRAQPGLQSRRSRAAAAAGRARSGLSARTRSTRRPLQSPADDHQHADRALRPPVASMGQVRGLHGAAGQSFQSGDGRGPDVPRVW